MLVLQWIWAERCSFVMGPLPAHHNSDGKGQRASNDKRHSSDDLLPGTWTTLVTCVVVVFWAGPSVIMRGTCDADGQTQGGNPPSVYLVVFREIVF